MTPMVWHQGIHDRMGMQRMRREGVEGAPGLVPWRGKGRSGTGVFAWCLSEFVEIEYKQPNSFGSRRGDQDRTSETVFIKLQKYIHTRSGGAEQSKLKGVQHKHTAASFSFLQQKRKQGSWKAKQAQREQNAEEMCGK